MAEVSVALCVSCAVLLVMAAGSTASAQTRAGSPIENTARLRWAEGGEVASNVDRIVAAERLDVLLTPAGGRAVTLTNLGNGRERFLLSATDASGAALQVAVDTDGDGEGEGADATPELEPGAAVRLLIDGMGVAELHVRAATGSGEPGTIFPALGDNGSDATVGRTGARATLRLGGTGPVLEKAQAVRAPDGSARAVAGAVITYTLQARFDAAVTGATVTDALPPGTRPVPGSLSLDGRPLTEAVDDDPGGVAGREVAVTLGDVPAAAAHVIRFQVIIE